MAQQQRAEGQIELKCHADKFFNAWTKETNHLTEILPHKFPKIELHEGTRTHCHSAGAVKTWHFVIDGSQKTVKTKVTKIDEKSKSVHYTYLDGELLRHYHERSLASKMQAIPKDNNDGCFVKWSIVYEKKTQDALDADVFIDFLLDCAKDMDASLCTA